MTKSLRRVAFSVMSGVLAVGMIQLSSAARTDVQRGRAAQSRTRTRVPRTNPQVPVAFGRPTIAGVQGSGFEEDLRIDPEGRVYTSVPGSLSSGTSWMWRSLDHGKTFKWVPAAQPFTGKLPTCAGGGDSELAVDSAGHVYFNDLTLANFSTGRSDDHGQSFPLFSCTSNTDTAVDREWYAVDGDPTDGGNLYLAYDIIGGSTTALCPTPADPNNALNNVLVMARSPIPGDLTGQSAGIQFAPPKTTTTGCNEAIMGNDEVSPTSHAIFVIHDNVALNQIRMTRCEAIDFTVDPTGLECTDKRVAKFPGYKTGANFPTMAIDKLGNIYAVWEQAPITNDGKVKGDSLLYWSSSTDDGKTWSKAVKIPTPNLHNNVMAWPAAGSKGRVAIAWYGTRGKQIPENPNGCMGPDAVKAKWSLWFTQTLNGTKATPTFSKPVVAGEHFVHVGNIQTLIGGQCGDRTLGDFIQMRVGPQGEANISFGDSNNIDEVFAPHAMFVRQDRGPSLFKSKGMVHGPKRKTNHTLDKKGDGTYEQNTISGPNSPNLDILMSRIKRPKGKARRFYKVIMKVGNLDSLAPNPSSQNPDTTLVWMTQWLVPSKTDPNGGKNFFAYMTSTGGNDPTFWDGQNAATPQGGGITLTYPGENEITGKIVRGEPGDPAYIIIKVPRKNVKVENKLRRKLFSVTASTITMQNPPESTPSLGGVGGVPFNLTDVAPAYDFKIPRRS